MHKISLNFYIIYLLIGFMDAVILVKFEIIQSAFLSKYLINSLNLLNILIKKHFKLFQILPKLKHP